MAVDRGLFIQPTAGGVGTTPAQARRNLAGLLTPNGDLGVVPGVLSGLTVTGVASGWTYQVTAGHAVTTRGATDGAVILGVDGNTNTPAPVLADGSPGSTSAPVSGSRYELIWILQRDLDAAEADNVAAIGVTQGTASGSPTRPAVPTGALVIAEALVPTGAANTAAGSVTITSVAAKVAVRGGTITVANSAQRDLLSPYADATHPVTVDRLDTGSIERSVGSGWKTIAAGGTKAWSHELVTGTASVPASVYTTYCTVSITDAPPGVYLLLGTILLNSSGGAVAVTLRFNANGTPITTDPRSDIDTTNRASTHTKIYTHTGGALIFTFQVNPAAIVTIQGQGTVLRAVLL